MPFLAGGAALAAYALLARTDHGRVLWVVAATLASPLFLRASESVRLPPPHRHACLYALVISICAFYLAFHLGSWDHRLIESVADLRDRSEPVRHGAGRLLSILMTALLPVIVTGFGLATRRRLLIDLGVLLGVASAVTLRFYVHVAPVWVVLVASGAAALLAALGLRRWLAAGSDGERGGLTAHPLFDDPRRRHLVEIAGVIATVAPAARAMPAESGGTLKTGGGDFGGGGASGDY
jgi:hypothetical protein